MRSVFVLCVVALVVSVSALCPVARSQEGMYDPPTVRFGVGVTRPFGQITDFDTQALHIGWYSDWGVSLSPPRPGGIEYAQLVWVDQGSYSPGLVQLGPVVDANPGSLWIVGNEPESIHQGNSTPQQYAAAYHDLYAFIKGRDPSAQIAIGGVTQPTPLRLHWLDLVLQQYQSMYSEGMPVDVWNTHCYILQERKYFGGCDIPVGLSDTVGRLYTIDDHANVAIFQQLIVEMRTWMRDRGYRDTPLIISEFGVLYSEALGFTEARVNAFMDGCFDVLLSVANSELGYPPDGQLLVQRWMWYSLNDQPYNPETGAGFNGALYDHRYPSYPGVITAFGINFRDYTEAILHALPPTQTHTPTPSATPTSTPTCTPSPTPTVTRTPIPFRRTKSDIDADGITDLVAFGPAVAAWSISKSSTDHLTGIYQSWGAEGDVPLSGDLDGDGKMDLIVYRPAYGVWFGLRSSNDYDTATPFVKGWGAQGDIPLSGDVDGDGKMDLIIYRPGVNVWFIATSSTDYVGCMGVAWGADGDVPISGDLDGDGKMDLIVYRPAYGVWFALLSTDGYEANPYFVQGWGAPGDTPVGGGDIDGDGKMDLIVYRPSVNVWFALLSSSNYSSSMGVAWGADGDLPIGGSDVDGDGKMDLVVYRPSVGVWFGLRSSNNYSTSSYLVKSWGASGDIPVW